MSQPVRLETQEEVDALAPGTHFIWADDGEEYTKQSGHASAAYVSSEDFRDLIRAQGSHRFKRSFSEEIGRIMAQVFVMLLFFGFLGLAYLVLVAWLVHAH